jgi:hypothetical protein
MSELNFPSPYNNNTFYQSNAHYCDVLRQNTKRLEGEAAVGLKINEQKQNI